MCCTNVFVFTREIGVPQGEPGKKAALASTIAFLPFILMFFFFAFYFYRDFARNKYEKSTKQIKELESIIVRLEQNDMTYCQNPSRLNSISWPSEQDNNNNHLNSINNNLYTKNNKRKHTANSLRQQFNAPTTHDPSSSLFLKKLCKYNVHSASNDHLLNESMKRQSISVDQIDKSDFGKDGMRNELRLDELYRSKLYDGCGDRNTALPPESTADCVRVSLDNVSYNSLNYNSLHNTIQNAAAFNAFAGRQFGGSRNQIDSYVSSRKVSSTNQKAKAKLQIASQSSKSINLDGSGAINDQQSNDSNRMLKKETESFNNLSTLVV